MARPIRVGIVGCGKIADVLHIPGYKNLKSARIASLYDVDAARAEGLRKSHKLDAEVFTDFDAYLASGLDATTICTPNFLHVPQTLAALKAGHHVLCEKPMAATTAEATRMIEAARRAGKVLQINQTLRYLPLYVTMANLVQGGAIGEPLHVRCFRTGATPPDQSWSPGAKWFVSAAAQGGVIRDIAVHMADFMQWAVGTITQVAAYVDTRTKGIDVPDNMSAIMRFENGATGVLELSWTTPVGGNTFEVFGTEGTLRQGLHPQHPIEILKPTRSGRTKAHYPKVPARVKDSHECFVATVLGKAPSPTPGEVGRGAVALCEAMAKAGELGKSVEVKRFG